MWYINYLLLHIDTIISNRFSGLLFWINGMLKRFDMNLNSNVSPKNGLHAYKYGLYNYTISTLDPKRRIFMYLTWFWIQNPWISPRCEKRIMCIAFHKPLWNNRVYRRIATVVEYKIMQVLLAFSHFCAFFIEMYRISALYFTMLCFKSMCIDSSTVDVFSRHELSNLTKNEQIMTDDDDNTIYVCLINKF